MLDIFYVEFMYADRLLFKPIFGKEICIINIFRGV